VEQRIVLKSVALILILTAQGFGQAPSPAPTVFTESTLAFKYIPPPNMYDLTAIDRQAIQKRAAALGTTNTLTLLLSLRFGSDDRAADWRTIGIESYPRAKLGTATDHDAFQKFSRSVAGVGTETTPPTDLQIGEFHFLVSNFELHEGELTKYARIFTTVRNGQLLSFAFSANSLTVLNTITESIKTVSR
jgi:hypothetical protein